MREEDAGTYQMLWDCTACGTDKLLGLDHRFCPNCGSAQDPKARYYPKEGEEVSAASHQFVGADLKCPACDTPCSAAATCCGGCGSALDGAKAVGVRSAQTASAGGFEADGAKAAKQDFKAQKAAARGDAPPAPPAPKKRSKLPLILGGIAVLVIALIVAFTWSRSVSIEATGHQWARTIDIEQMKTVTESAWENQVPFKAYGKRCTKEVRSKKKVKDGEKCTTKRKDRGDGTFKKVKVCKPKYKEKPVYGQKCRFKIDKWKKTRTLEAKGAKDQTPAWPSVELSRTGTCLGCERAGARRERYTVSFKNLKSGEAKSCELPAAKWSSIEVGSKWEAKAGVISGNLDCDALKPSK